MSSFAPPSKPRTGNKNKCTFNHDYMFLNQKYAAVINQKFARLKYLRTEKKNGTVKHIIQEFVDLILRGTESRQASAQEPRPVGAPKVRQTRPWQRSVPFVLYARL